MNNATWLPPLQVLIGSIQRCDRWAIHHRLQELNIACACPADGSLCVDINHPTDVILTHSIVRQFISSRQDHIDWLDRCWHTQGLCPTDH